MSALNLLLLALATWRCAFMVAREHGPFHVFEKVRARYPLGGLTACTYCLSVWFALAFYALLLTDLAPVVYVLAVSGGAMLMHRYTGGDLV